MKARASIHSVHKGLLSIISRAYVDDLDACVSAQEVEDEFQTYRVIRRIWIARKSPGYAFVDFDDCKDAQDAIRDLDSKHN